MLPIYRYVRVAWLLPGLLLAGCGPSHPKTLSVSGTVTYHKEPLAGAGIVFFPKDGEKGLSPAMGQTDANGKYTLKTLGDNGAMPGEYQVFITASEPLPPGSKPGDEPKSRIPKKYGSTSSGLTASVARGHQDLNFDLE